MRHVEGLEYFGGPIAVDALVGCRCELVNSTNSVKIRLTSSN